MTVHWKLHECDNLPPDGIQVLWSKDNIIRKTKTWQLIIRRGATDEDLQQNHILEEEGQTIWETRIEISHCPFCGEYLLDENDDKFENLGKFVHFDYSEWNSKMQ